MPFGKMLYLSHRFSGEATRAIDKCPGALYYAANARNGQPLIKEGNRVKDRVQGSVAVTGNTAIIVLVLTWGSPPGAAVAL